MFILLPQACSIHVNSLKRHINTKKWQWQSLYLHTSRSTCTANVHKHTLTSSHTHMQTHAEKTERPCQDAVNFWGQIHQAPSAAPLLFDFPQGGRDKTPTDRHEPQTHTKYLEKKQINSGEHAYTCKEFYWLFLTHHDEFLAIHIKIIAISHTHICLLHLSTCVSCAKCGLCSKNYFASRLWDRNTARQRERLRNIGEGDGQRERQTKRQTFWKEKSMVGWTQRA